MKLEQRFEMEKQLIAARGQPKMEVVSRPVTVKLPKLELTKFTGTH